MSGVPVTAKIYLLQMEPTSFFLFFLPLLQTVMGSFTKGVFYLFLFLVGKGGMELLSSISVNLKTPKVFFSSFFSNLKEKHD